MSKQINKIASDLRKIYINGGSDSQIFDFIRLNIEKITKSQFVFIATLDYDIVEKYDYLYVNSATGLSASNSFSGEMSVDTSANVDDTTLEEDNKNKSQPIEKRIIDNSAKSASRRSSYNKTRTAQDGADASQQSPRRISNHAVESKAVSSINIRSSIDRSKPREDESEIAKGKVREPISTDTLQFRGEDSFDKDHQRPRSFMDSLRSRGKTVALRKSFNSLGVSRSPSSADDKVKVSEENHNSDSTTPEPKMHGGSKEEIADSQSGKKECPIYHSRRILSLSNVFGQVIRTDSIVIDNNILPAAFKGMPTPFPENHIKINTLMGIPINCAGLVIGIVCCVNSDKYSQKSYEKIDQLIEICSVYMMWFKERKSEIGQRNTLAEIKKGSRDGIVDIDAKCKILEMNAAAEEILGYSSHELIGKNFMKYFPDKEMRRGITEYVMRVYNKKEKSEASIENKSHDDSSGNSASNESRNRFLGDTGELSIKQQDGGITYVTLRFVKTSFKTMIVMIRTVDDMVRDRQIAEQSNKYKDLFVANVTHELKTPLNGILGMGVQLLKTELTEKQRTYCNIIVNSGEELSKIIGDILDLSKLENGKLGINLKPFSISDCLESCYRTVDFSIKDKQIEYNQLITNRVPSAIIGDADRIKQIIGNLLSNAIKFTDHGSISIRVDAHKKSNDADGQEIYAISISVADTGIGIKKGDLGKLFKPFSQIDQGTTKVYKGTGLGLSISQKLANLMQGELTVESEYGTGTTFTLKFIAKKYDTLLITPEFKKEVGGLFNGRRSIIIDDNSVNRTVICGILINWGMEVITCASADEALIFIQSGAKFDIGLVDINMPKKDGNHLARLIRKTNLNLSLIAISSSGSEKIETDLFDDYCEKPIKESELIGKMLALFSRPGIKPSRPLTVRAKKDMCILIVEDNPTNQFVLTDKLEELGYSNYKVVGNGRQGYEEIKGNTRKYKLIFMDIKMPVMDGKEASIRIKNIYGWRESYAALRNEPHRLYSNASSQNISRSAKLRGDEHHGKKSDESEHSSDLTKSQSTGNVSKGRKRGGSTTAGGTQRGDAGHKKHKRHSDTLRMHGTDSSRIRHIESDNFPIEKGNSKNSSHVEKIKSMNASDPARHRRSTTLTESAKYCPFICALSATSIKEEEKILLDKEIFDDYMTKPIDDNELVRVLNKFE